MLSRIAGRAERWLARGGPVLDLGCADGALAFFLESMSLRVHALDHPTSNYNRMQGVRALDYLVAGSGDQAERAASDADARAFLSRKTAWWIRRAICG
jgi:hypothetical protein